MKTGHISARIDQDLKVQGDLVLHELGITATQAINMLYKHLVREHELPIPVRVPKKALKKAIEDARNKHDLSLYKSTDELFKDLGI